MELNAYRIMWIMVLYDLPTETAGERKAAALFRKRIMQDGFSMMQWSAYTRHCSSRQNMDTHIQRVKRIIPEKGMVVILNLTDKQFGEMVVYYGRKAETPKPGPQQLEMF